MRKGMARFREELDKMPPEAVQCMKDAAGEENFDKMIAGEPVFDRSIEAKMKSCFGKVTAQFSKQISQLPPEAAECITGVVGEEGLQKLQGGEFHEEINFESLEGCFQQLRYSFGEGSNFDAGGFSGPGGCKNMEECTAYCQEHLDECKGFGPPPGSGGNMGGFQGGPGGCASKEECMSYCEEHPEQCGGGFGGGIGEQQMSCSPKGTVASFVCGKNGRNTPSNLEVTYFNSCTAKEHGAEIIHEGVCESHTPCGEIADPVCGNDNNTWVSACYAEKEGGGVQYPGPCKTQSSGSFSGPGGCTNKEECMNYCTKNYTDPACQKFMPPSTSSTPSVPPDYQQQNYQQPYQYQQQYQQPNTGTFPGGCTTKECVIEYCTKNYTDSACQQLMPSSDYQQPYQQEYNQPYQEPQPSTNYTLPGGCTTKECVTEFCTKNYTDPACQQFAPSATSGSLLHSPLLEAVLGPLLLLFK